MLFHKVSRHVAQRNPRKSFLLYNQVRGKSIQNWKRPTMDEYLGVVHQIISPISNSESTIFLTNIYYDFFFNWQTEKKTPVFNK